MVWSKQERDDTKPAIYFKMCQHKNGNEVKLRGELQEWERGQESTGRHR